MAINDSALQQDAAPPHRGALRQTARFISVAVTLGRQYRALRRYERLSEKARAQQRRVPQQFAQTLFDLGPLFIKLGQVMSTRPDLLPPDYIAELARLQEHAPPVPYERIQATVRDELGQPIEEVFATFESEPVAAASLAQTHLATLADGSAVAVKVQRPFVCDELAADLAMLGATLRIANWFFPGRVRRLNLLNGFAEFRRYTMQELDFTIEAQTIERFQRNFASWEDIQIPQVRWPLVTSKVLTMERVSGLRLAELAPRLSDAERQRLTHRLIEMEMKMFIADGLFHADLHPGNIFFTPDGGIILLDFGMYGELSDEHRDRFILYWLAAAQRQTRRAFYHLIQQTERQPGADEAAYYARFAQLANRFYSSTITEQSITRTYLDFILNGARYGFIFPSDLLLQAKALTTAEALAMSLTPDLRFEREVGPIIARQAARRMLDIERLWALIERSGPELLLLGEALPQAALASDGASEDLRVEDERHIAWWDALQPALKHLTDTYTPSVTQLREALDDPARQVLIREYSRADMARILDDLWARYTALSAELPTARSLGARLMLHLSAATIAMYQALMGAGQSPAHATDLVYEIAWDVYTKMGAVPKALADGMGVDNAEQLRFVTEAFRRFPFSAPDYRFETVTSDKPGLVAFNCLQCPVANFFRKQQLPDLCVNTWCKLDYPLARQWNADLQRSGTIAGGAPLCDFRWQAQTAPPEPSEHP